MDKWIEIEYDEERAEKVASLDDNAPVEHENVTGDPPWAAEWYVWAPNSGEIVLNSQWWHHLDASFDKIGTLL